MLNRPTQSSSDRVLNLVGAGLRTAVLLDMAHRLRLGRDIVLAGQTVLQVSVMISDLSRHMGHGVVEGSAVRWDRGGYAYFFTLEPDQPRVADLICISAAWCDALHGFKATRNQIGQARNLVRNLCKVVRGVDPKILITGPPAWP